MSRTSDGDRNSGRCVEEGNGRTWRIASALAVCRLSSSQWKEKAVVTTLSVLQTVSEWKFWRGNVLFMGIHLL